MEDNDNSSSAASISVVTVNNPWDNQTTRLLIATRLKYESEFKDGRNKKNLLWDTVLNEMRKVNKNFKLTTLEINKKFHNLLITYKRIKQRSLNAGGEVKTSWEYFDTFDAVYADSFIEENLKLQSIDNNAGRDPLLEGALPDSNFDYWSPLLNDLPSTSTHKNKNNSSEVGRKKNRLSSNSIINYLKEYDIKCEKRHRQTLKVEIKKIKIEEEKLKILTEIRDILKEIRY